MWEWITKLRGRFTSPTMLPPTAGAQPPVQPPRTPGGEPPLAQTLGAEAFRAELNSQLSRAEKRGHTHWEINSGELHRKIGGYPGTNHRMPICCDVMYSAQQEGDEVISSPPAGKGAGLTIRYKLPRRINVEGP
jgi:5-methylcytosine-specific restriction protein A